jgi:phenylacetate-CoA ligase
VLALFHQFEETQWGQAERLVEHQFRQLVALLSHFNRFSSYYRPRLENFKEQFGRALNPETFRSLPPLTRAEIRVAGDALFVRELPEGHQQFRYSGSSGSSGPPVTIWKTEINDIFHAALNLRAHMWHGRDLDASLASIRRFPHGTAMPPAGATGGNWASGVRTGASLALNSAFSTLGEQFSWLEQAKPGYVFSYPSLLHGLALHCEREGRKLPWLKGLMTFGEIVTPTQRESAKRVFGCGLRDSYSAAEVSVIALECPEAEGVYHVQSESVIVEIVDSAGRPCPTGQAGRVLLTDLHNFATPVIRYEIGDIAEWGEPCQCGRGLPVLRRIVGRSLNLLRLPDGDTLIPDIERQDLHTLAPVRQAQVIQRSFTEMEVRLAVDRPLRPEEIERVRQAVLRGLHDRPFALSFTFLDEIPRSEAGKYEAFICELR